jgi:C1A family cysteine protease
MSVAFKDEHNIIRVLTLFVAATFTLILPLSVVFANCPLCEPSGATTVTDSLIQDDLFLPEPDGETPLMRIQGMLTGTNSSPVSLHHLTQAEAEDLKEVLGTQDSDEEYNLLIEGLGTGLTPPSEEEWVQMVGSTIVVEVGEYSILSAPSAYDLSTDPCFPQVRSQGGQGSCAAWATTYYAYGYLEAKDNGWTDASTGNDVHLMSPAWTYNKVNGGTDSGSSLSGNARIIRDWGATSMANMPYNDQDPVSWGTESAWREAPLHRSVDSFYISYNGDSTVQYVKDLIYSGTPLVFAMDAYEYNPAFSDGNYIMSSFEYDSTTINHAQTFVGYDDSVTDDGETGAFKVVNSWGTNFADDGYYWLTYDAFKEMGSRLSLRYLEDKSDYVPSIVATWEFSSSPSREADFEAGIGSYSSPTSTKVPYYSKNSASYNHVYPGFMCLDITEFQSQYNAGNHEFYLEVSSSDIAGTLSSFLIEIYQGGYSPGSPSLLSSESPDVPMNNPGYVTNMMESGSDIIPPSISIYEPQDGEVTSLTQITVSWTGSDAESGIDHYDVKLDASSWTDMDTLTSHTFTNLTQGSHSVQVRAYDCSGNDASDIVSFCVDSTNPWVDILSPSNDALISSSSLTVSWTGSDAVSGIDYYMVSLDQGAWIDVGAQTSRSFSGLAQGSHTVQVRAYDMAGNYETDEVSFTLDSLGPNLEIIDPTDGTISSSTTVDVSWTGFDSGSGIDRYEVRMDQGFWLNVGSQISHQFTSVSQGDHTVEVRAYDLAGNIALESASFTIDTISPSVGIITPEEGEELTQSNVEISWSVTDAGGVDHIELRLDGGGWNNMGLGTSTFLSLDDGSHIIDVRAFDFAGNIGQDSVNFNVDSSMPSVEITSPSNGSILNHAQFTASWIGDDGGSGIEYYEFMIDDDTWTSCGLSTSMQLELEDGSHSFQVRAVDGVGHTTSDSVGFTIDTISPLVTLINPNQGILDSSSIIVEWQGYDSGLGILEFELKVDGQLVYSGTNIQYGLSSLDEGTHFLIIRAYDLAMNWAEESFTFTIDTVDPYVAIVYPSNGEMLNSSTVTLQWQSWDATSGVSGYWMRLDSGNWNGIGNATSMTIWSLDDGYHEVDIMAVDQAENQAIDSVVFSIWTGVLEIEIVSPHDGELLSVDSTTATWAFSGSPFGIDHYELRLDYGYWSDMGLQTTCNLHFLETDWHTLEVRVFDGVGNSATDTVHFEVDTLAPTVFITSPMEGEGIAASFVVVSWNIEELGSGLISVLINLDGGDWIHAGEGHTFTSVSPGNHIITLWAVDEAGNSGSATVNFTIETMPLGVDILRPAEGEIVSNSDIEIAWSGVETVYGIDHYEIRVDDGAWLNVGLNDTYQIEGLSEGVHEILVMIVDGIGDNASSSITITVDVSSPSVEIISPSSGITRDTTLLVQWSGSDAISGVDHFQFRIDEGPWQVTTGTSTTIGSLQDGEHVFEVVIFDQVGHSSSDSLSITVDTTPPELEILDPVDGLLTNHSDIEVRWSLEDADYSSLEIRIDGSEWMSIGAVESLEIDLDGEGEHILELRVNDEAGNTAVDSVSVYLDITPPILLIETPEEFQLFNSSAVCIAWHALDYLSEPISYYISIDGGSWMSLGSTTLYNIVDLDDGDHTVAVKAFDQAGNAFTRSVSYKVDTSPPSLEIEWPSEGSVLNQTDVTISWTASDLTSQVLSIVFSIDSGIWIDVTGNSTFKTTFPDGVHIISVKVEDLVGNCLVLNTSFTMDTELPYINFLSPVLGSRINLTSVYIEWDAGDNQTGLHHCLVSIDEGPWLDVGTDHNLTVQLLGEGSHIIIIMALDGAGHFQKANVSVIVDTIAPSVVNYSPVGDSVEIDAPITITFSEPMDIGSVEIRLNDLEEIPLWNGQTAILNPSNDFQYGSTYTLEIFGKDCSGNQVEAEWSFSTIALGIISGIVLDDDDQPIANALVSLNTGESTTTNSEGHFVLEAPPGSYTITITKEGYGGKVMDVQVSDGQTQVSSNLEPLDDSFSLDQNMMLILIIGIISCIAIAGIAVRSRHK